MDRQLLEHGRQKFPDADLIASSEGRFWSGLHAEMRRHPAGELPPFVSSVTEITYAVQGRPEAVVHRTGAGYLQSTPVRQGVLWICPEGVFEADTRITGNLPNILHICLPSTLFARLAGDDPIAHFKPEQLRYEADPDDPLLRQLARSIHHELREETSAGRLLVETSTLTLGARLVHSWLSSSPAPRLRPPANLQGRRMKRVLDYLHDRLDEDLSIADLAAIACLSPFHFARAFKAATGSPPHRYLSRMRMERAKALLSQGDLPISEIAHMCQFSSQANFTRAFTRSVGVSPGRYRVAKVT